MKQDFCTTLQGTKQHILLGNELSAGKAYAVHSRVSGPHPASHCTVSARVNGRKGEGRRGSLVKEKIKPGQGGVKQAMPRELRASCCSADTPSPILPPMNHQVPER